MSQLSIFYDTNKSHKISGNRVKADNQGKKVLSFFKANPASYFTPFDIQKLCMPDTPITSVRRCMTDLTNNGYIVKSDKRKMGDFGELNYMWTLEKTLF